MKQVTVDRVLERLNYARANGFDLGLFLQGPAQAEEAGERYLEQRLASGTVHAFNNDAQVLNNLTTYLGFPVRFKLRKTPPTAPRALDRDQIRRLTHYAHPIPEVNRFRRALILVHLETGARPSEVAKLELQDLDAKRSRIHIRHPAKGGMVRWIPVSRWIWSRRRPLGAFLANRATPVENPNALWSVRDLNQNESWGPIRATTVDYMRRTLAAVSEDVGFRVNANILRHTKATELRRRGFDILYIKFILGHASISSTQVYAELSPGDVETLYRRKPTPDYYQGERP